MAGAGLSHIQLMMAGRLPKFILSDKVCLKGGLSQTVMCIQKFKTIVEEPGRNCIYTGLVYCYWFEGKYPRRDIFHEDELEVYRMYA